MSRAGIDTANPVDSRPLTFSHWTPHWTTQWRNPIPVRAFISTTIPKQHFDIDSEVLCYCLADGYSLCSGRGKLIDCKLEIFCFQQERVLKFYSCSLLVKFHFNETLIRLIKITSDSETQLFCKCQTGLGIRKRFLITNKRKEPISFVTLCSLNLGPVKKRYSHFTISDISAKKKN
jgi:hypothetical protein